MRANNVHPAPIKPLELFPAPAQTAEHKTFNIEAYALDLMMNCGLTCLLEDMFDQPSDVICFGEMYGSKLL